MEVDRLGATCRAIPVSMDSNFAGSTLSAVISVRINGSESALLKVSSCADTLIRKFLRFFAVRFVGYYANAG